MKKLSFVTGLVALLFINSGQLFSGEIPASAPTTAPLVASPGTGENAAAALARAGQEKKFLYLLIQDKQDEPAASAKKTVEAVARQHSAQAAWYELDRNKPSEKELVEKYDLLRAPTPLVMVIAPNGGITAGLFGEKLTSQKLGESLVSIGIQQLVKAMQERKLAFLCVQNAATTSNEVAMKGVNEFKSDPKHATDTEIIRVDPADASEGKLLAELKIDSKTSEAVTAFLAPPGASLGVFTGATTKEKFESTLKAALAGECGPGGCGPGGCGK